MRAEPLWKAVWAVALISGGLAGCDHVDRTRSLTVATNHKWRVIAIGRLDSPRTPFTTNVVEFEVLEGSRPHSRGPLYEAGGLDAGFKERFTRTDWLDENTLRLWHLPTEPERRQHRLSVRNQGPKSARWLLISALPDQLFLMLELAPRSEVTLPLLQSGAAPSLYVDGQYADGSPIRPQNLQLDRYGPSLSLTLHDGAVTLQSDDVRQMPK